MPELYLGQGLGTILTFQTKEGKLIGTISASLFPSNEPPMEVHVYLQYEDKLNEKMGINGVIVRFEEVIQ